MSFAPFVAATSIGSASDDAAAFVGYPFRPQLEGDGRIIRWADPFRAVLEPIGTERVRLLLSANDQLVRTVEYEMDETFARLAADGIMALFEPET
jgi:hypothetical protein